MINPTTTCIAITGCLVAFSATGRATPEAVAHLSGSVHGDKSVDEKGYAAYLAERVLALRGPDTDSCATAECVKRRLASVNYALAYQCEPLLSRRLHRIVATDDDELLRNVTDQALAELLELERSVDRLKADAGDDDTVQSLADPIATLRAFAVALGSLAKPADATDARLDAAGALSVYLEDDRSVVAAAARLWQAELYDAAGRRDRVARLLPVVTEPIGRETMRYDFFGRLLRCHDLIADDSYGAAWSMLILLEERSENWFGDKSTKAEAVRSAVLPRFDLCRRWSQPGRAGSETTAGWCDRMTAELRLEYFPDSGDRGLLRLTTAAPVVVDIPEASESETDQDDAPKP